MDDLSTMTDAELSAAVAVEVMGARPWPQERTLYRLPGRQHEYFVPAYATDPTQATELLESERRAGRCWTIYPYKSDDDCYEVRSDFYRSRLPATTWPRALSEAVLAYHRSKSDD